MWEEEGGREKLGAGEMCVLVGLANRAAFWQFQGHVASHQREMCGMFRKMKPCIISPKYSLFHVAQNNVK